MLKKGLALVLLIWMVWVGYQYFTKSETARVLVFQKLQELGRIDTATLAQKLGEPYTRKKINTIRGKYWVIWGVRRVKSGANQNNKETLEVDGRVDFIELLPFGKITAGFRFELVLK